MQAAAGKVVAQETFLIENVRFANLGAKIVIDFNF